MGNALLYRCELDPVLRELAILRVGRLSRAAYEVFQHERIAREAGVTDDKIAALRDATIEAPAFSDNEKAVLRFADDVVRNVRASDKTLKAVAGLPDAGRAGRAHAHRRLLHDGLPLPRDDRASRARKARRSGSRRRSSRSPAMAYRVLIAQFMHETNTFSKLPTTLDDYRRRWLIEGEAIVPRFTGTRNEIGGYIDAVAKYGWQPV